MKKLALAVVAVSLIGCTKYGVPRTIVSVGRSAVAFADGAFAAVQVERKKVCAKMAEPDKAKCNASVDKSQADYSKVKRNALDGFDTTDKIVDALDKSGGKDFLSWLPVLKSTVCTVDGIFSWLSKKAQDHIVVKALRAFVPWAGCK